MEIGLIIVGASILVGGINIALFILFKTESYSREYEAKNQRVVENLLLQLKEGVDRLNKKTKGIKVEDLKSTLSELNDLSWTGSKIKEWGAHISRGKTALRVTAGAAFVSMLLFFATFVLLAFSPERTEWQSPLILGVIFAALAATRMSEYMKITKSIEARSEDLNMGRSILDAMKKEEEEAKQARLI